MARTVSEYLKKTSYWKPELIRLRELLCAMDVEETVRWGQPCYTHAGKLVVGLVAFKSYVGLWFFEGARLPDPDGVLVNAQEGKTKSMRQWRFTSGRDIKPRRIRAYVRDAIAIATQDKDKPPAPRRAKPLRIPPELKLALDRSARTREAFGALTPGRQREYAEHVAEAKQEATRLRRVTKILPMIRAGKGLSDRHR